MHVRQRRRVRERERERVRMNKKHDQIAQQCVQHVASVGLRVFCIHYTKVPQCVAHTQNETTGKTNAVCINFS